MKPEEKIEPNHHNLPKANFGKGDDGKTVDWRNKLGREKHKDDDEELDKTPPEVVGMLGFDPKEDEYNPL